MKFNPDKNNNQESLENLFQEKARLLKELIESNKTMTFPGITAEAYDSWTATMEEFPEFTTPIDKLIEQMENQKMKFVVNEGSGNGDFVVLPNDSNDILYGSIPSRDLDRTKVTDKRLQRILELEDKIREMR